MEFGLTARGKSSVELVAAAKVTVAKDAVTKGAVVKGEPGEAKVTALKSVAVEGFILGEFVQVKITQKYKNEGQAGAEFIYTFPLPDNASVCGFWARVGGRSVRGEVMERQEAFREYDAAVRRGDSACLLESYRPNIFQVSLGQAGPGEEIELEIYYVQEIKVTDGEMRLAVPTVVAPRYIPGKAAGERLGLGVAQPTDRVPDADFISPNIGHADYCASINFQVHAGGRIAGISSPSHEIEVESTGGHSARVSLTRGETAMDRDFILSIGVFEEQAPGCMVGDGGRGRHFAYAYFTPELPAPERVQGTEYIFLIDISGSMDGEKLSQAKDAINICLRNLTGADSFNLAAFESSLHKFSRVSQGFDQQSLDSASAWVGGLSAMGGTEVLPAVRFALGNSSGAGLPKVVMLFTDGQVGNEEEVIRVVRAGGENVRFYTIGIDTAVNSYFINGLAQAGNGWAEFVYPGENVTDKVIRQFARVNAAWLENISLEAGGVKSIEVAGGMPARLYDCEAASLIFKTDSPPEGKVVVSGRCGGQKVEIIIDNLQRAEDAGPLEKLWARRKVQELEALLNTGNPRRHRGIQEDIIKISKEYGVASSLTSFVAVHERENKLSGLQETVVVPVSSPRGWDMFGSSADADMPVIAGFAAVSSSKNSFNSLSSCRSVVSYDEPHCLAEDLVEPVYNEFSSIRAGEPGPGEPGAGQPGPGLEGSYSADLDVPDAGRALLGEGDKDLTSMLSREVKGQAARQCRGVKALAASQNSDGSFGAAGIAVGEILLQTAEVVITFASGRGDIAPYRNQLLKALEFLASGREDLLKDGRLARVAYSALELSAMRKVIRAKGPAAVLALLAELKIMFAVDREFRRLIDLIEIKDIAGIEKLIKEKTSAIFPLEG